MTIGDDRLAIVVHHDDVVERRGGIHSDTPANLRMLRSSLNNGDGTARIPRDSKDVVRGPAESLDWTELPATEFRRRVSDRIIAVV